MNSLYTFVPPKDAIRALTERISTQREVSVSLTPGHITAILDVILHNTFTFNGQVYIQTNGLPMGSSISSLLAITFLNRLEHGPFM